MTTIQFEINNTGVAYLTVSRPKALNALNSEVFSDLEKLLLEIESNSSIKCLVITGEGKSFVAGADIKEMSGHSAEQAQEMSQRGQHIFNRISGLPFPTIAAVNGFALGGGLELAMSCDIILASEKAKLGLPEVSLGLIPGYGGTQRLSRLIGTVKANRVVFTGDIFTAQKMADWGLVSDVFSLETFKEEVDKVASKIASQSPVAVASAKKAVAEGMNTHFKKGLVIEADLFSKCFTTQDSKEGIAAFLEKRKPEFTGA